MWTELFPETSKNLHILTLPKKFHWIPLPRKLQDILLNNSPSNVWKKLWKYHSHANYKEWIWTSSYEAVGSWLFERSVRSWFMIFQGMILKYIEGRKCVKFSEFCVWREDLARVLVRVRAVLLELDRYEKPNIGWKLSFWNYFALFKTECQCLRISSWGDYIDVAGVC